MRIVTLSVLLAASAVLAGAARAQDAPAYVPSEPYTWSEQQRSDPPSRGMFQTGDPGPALVTDHFHFGVAALEANDFAKAERIFAKTLRYNSGDAAARFYMGVTKMKLEKWDEAKRYLKTPARVLRKAPEPKGHLGVTYAKLGDIAGAKAQRAALVKLAERCSGTCELSPHIADGIKMIDEALSDR